MTQLLCPVVVGRERELSLLRERVVEARGGRGGVVFIVGEAGIGKSRLTREAEAMAREQGTPTLRGRAVQTSTPLPFRPVMEALQGAHLKVTSEAPELLPYRRALARLVPDWSEDELPASTEFPPLLVFEGLLQLLRSLAGDEGLVIVLEDLHWADEDSLAAVEYLSDHLPSEPVLCLCTVRSDELGPGSRLPDQLAARRTATVISLSRLREAEAEEMIHASLTDHSIPSNVVEAVSDRAEGVPFLVEELLSALVGAESDTERSAALTRTLPRSYRDLIQDRLAALPGDSRSVMVAAAILGRTFDWSLLPGITRLGERTVLAALRRAVNGHLIEGAGGGSQVAFGFRHALAREAVLNELLPPEASDLSIRAARVIEEQFPGLPGEWCELAAGLREDGGDSLGAARHLLEAGRRALARSAVATAETNLERARSLAGEDPWLVLGIGRVLVEALALSGKVERLRQVADELLRFFDNSAVAELWSHLMAPVHLQIARGHATAGGGPGEVREHLQRARRLAKRSDEALVSRIDGLGAQVALGEGDLVEAAEVAGQALPAAERLGLPDVMCEALEVLGQTAFLQRDPEEAVSRLRKAAAIAEDHGLNAWRARILLALGTVERCRTGDLATLRAALAAVADTGAVAIQTRIELELGRGLLEGFELDAALKTLTACASGARRYGLPLLPDALLSQALAAALLDRSAEADALAQEVSALAVDPSRHSGEVGRLRSVLALLAGKRAEAVEEMERTVGILAEAPPTEPQPLLGLWALAGALAGDHHRANEVGISIHAAHRITGGYLAFAEAVRLGERGGGGGASSRFESAERTMQPFPWDRHVGRLLTLEGAARDGWGWPAAWIGETLAFFDEAGHRGLVNASKRILRLVGAPVPRRGRGDSAVPKELRSLGVTSREMDVLRLVGEGLSNPEIAERLHLSRRTVESHVGSLLRRTGASTRRELADLVRL